MDTSTYSTIDNDSAIVPEKGDIVSSQSILSKKELKELAKLNFIGGDFISNIIMRLLSLNKLNKFYEKYNGPGGIDFVNFVASELGIKFEIDEESLTNIPQEGAFVTVSNHPFGGIDGVGMFKLILPHRSDYKTLTNYVLQRVKPLNRHIISVDPFVSDGKARMNISGIKAAMRHLKEGHPLGLFPSGEVSSYNCDYTGICDKKWDKSIMRMVQKAEVPVIPFYFHGTNSKMFHLMGRINPALRTAKIPSEVFNKKNRTIHISIGAPIAVEEQKQYVSIDSYIEFIRNRTYSLASPKRYRKRRVVKSLEFSNRTPSNVEPVAAPLSHITITKEIEFLKRKCSLIKKGSFELFCAKHNKIPALMHEIGRQREITFRAVGEGSNKSLDLDSYDRTYHHLIIWDHAEHKLVGAYRIGNGKELIDRYGVEALYTSSLFDYNKAFIPKLKSSIELGRSFVTQDYQRKTIPLYMLWGGIFEFIQRNPWCNYLFGPVSISDNLDKLDKDRIVSYIHKHHRHQEFKNYVTCKNEYIVDENYSLEEDDTNFKSLKLPILFRKYLEINGKIIDFNVDPLFNNCLDGLLFLDLSEVPESFINRFRNHKCQIPPMNHSFEKAELKRRYSFKYRKVKGEV